MAYQHGYRETELVTHDFAETKKGKYVFFNDPSSTQWFSYRLFDVKHMVIVTYLFRGNPLSPHRLLFPIITSKGSFIITFPRQYHTHHSLWWTSYGPQVGTENSPNYKCLHHADSIGWSQILQASALLPELRPASIFCRTHWHKPNV